MTLTALSDATGISKSTLSRLETGQRRASLELLLPLTRSAGGLQARKINVPACNSTPAPETHEGYEWLFVLSGRVRLVLGDHDLVLGAGEAVEFETRVPHWFGSTGEEPGGDPQYVRAAG